MNTSNSPEVIVEQPQKQSQTKNIIIGLLALALVGVSGYLFVEKNKAGETIQTQQTQIAKVVDEKTELQKSFDGSLVRLDSLKSVNTGLESKLTASSAEIEKTKKEIRTILYKKNATAAELTKAKNLIASLNSRISNMEQDIARLTKENETLTADKQTLTATNEILNRDLTTTTVAKQNLEKKVDIASTLNATNIAVTPIDVRHNGKEVATTVAKRVDKMLVSFDVENRIAPTGQTDIYVCVIGPDGKAITVPNLGSGNFNTRDEGEKAFTSKVQADIETAVKKHIEFSFMPQSTFEKGDYTIQIYQNGYKIGEKKAALRKGGLFS